MDARSRWRMFDPFPAGQPAHDGVLLLAGGLGDRLDVHVEHRRIRLPFQLPGE